ncbi:MAG: MBL fold metallo-hydrolase [Acidobacteria bacterium]|nr:MBL fold metallo-hydrolase [Acidobacteriota bacterium]
MTLRRLRLQTSWGRVEVTGASRAGDGTIVLLPQFRLALDAGRAAQRLPSMSTLFLSHGHMDHIGGLGYWAAQRSLGALGPGTILAPRPIVPALRTLLNTMSDLEGGRPYDIEVKGVSDGGHHRLKRDVELAFFATDHWVVTLGCQLIWRRTRLRPELKGTPPDEIIRLRAAGKDVARTVETPLLAYCADTGPGLFVSHPEVFAAEIVLLECSFFAPEDIERARTYGHLHVDDLMANASLLRCQHLVLLHASRRYRLADLEEKLTHEIAPNLPCQLHHLLVDW